MISTGIEALELTTYLKNKTPDRGRVLAVLPVLHLYLLLLLIKKTKPPTEDEHRCNFLRFCTVSVLIKKTKPPSGDEHSFI